VKCCCLILPPFPVRKSVSVTCFILLKCLHFKCEWKRMLGRIFHPVKIQ
jgi:hypothetical protein